MSSYVLDNLLGYIPRAGMIRPNVTVNGDGLRSCGDIPVTSDAPPILAVGDSFTWGQDVADEETWPACVQALTGRRVLNGGVSGYGLDQTVLRAEILAKIHRPSDIVVSFIADDVLRTEMSRLWGYSKPWFALDGEGLALRNVPVLPWRPLGLPAASIKRFCFKLPYALQIALGFHQRAQRRGTGLRIAERLVDRLAVLQAEIGCRITVLAQSEAVVRKAWVPRSRVNARRGLAQVVIDRSRERGLALIDCHPVIDAAPRPADLFADIHMTAEGNRLVARLVAKALSSL